MGSEPEYAVHRTTNALLVVHPDKDRPRKKYYPSPDYEHNTIDAPWAPTKIEKVEDEIDRVRVPLTGKFWQPGKLVVREGDHVQRGDDLAVPALDGLSVGVHASIPGRISQITDEFVEIRRE
jgi:biotin carboxyl carrier protein